MEGAELNRLTSATSESSKDDHFLPEQRLAEEIFKLFFWYFYTCFPEQLSKNKNAMDEA